MIELTQSEMSIRIVVALLVGAVIGLEREWEEKPAGMRTFALVSLGAALFMIGAILLSNEFRASGTRSDPGRIASNIVQGIGFLAGGVIITSKGRVRGLTTAVAVWVTASIGMLIGAGFFFPAIVGAISLLVMLSIFRRFERHISKTKARASSDSEEPNV